jgi:hypothetical protein
VLNVDAPLAGWWGVTAHRPGENPIFVIALEYTGLSVAASPAIEAPRSSTGPMFEYPRSSAGLRRILAGAPDVHRGARFAGSQASPLLLPVLRRDPIVCIAFASPVLRDAPLVITESVRWLPSRVGLPETKRLELCNLWPTDASVTWVKRNPLKTMKTKKKITPLVASAWFTDCDPFVSVAFNPIQWHAREAGSKFLDILRNDVRERWEGEDSEQTEEEFQDDARWSGIHAMEIEIADEQFSDFGLHEDGTQIDLHKCALDAFPLGYAFLEGF